VFLTSHDAGDVEELCRRGRRDRPRPRHLRRSNSRATRRASSAKPRAASRSRAWRRRPAVAAAATGVSGGDPRDAGLSAGGHRVGPSGPFPPGLGASSGGAPGASIQMAGVFR